MRILNRASVAFFILNDYSKSPINTANITCNGKTIVYAKKSDGYYVFVNLEKGEYRFDITCDGFEPVSYKVKLSDLQPMQITVNLKYSPSSNDLNSIRKAVFDVKNNGKLAIGVDVRVKLDTKVPFLRMIEPIESGSNIIKLNSDFEHRLLYQDYAYDKKANMIISLKGYDHIEKTYINSKVYKSDIEEGGLLNPMWTFKTDKFGRFTLPMNGVFFSKSSVELSIYVLRKKFKVVVNTEDTEYVSLEVKDKEAE